MNCQELKTRIESQHESREAPTEAMLAHAATCASCADALRADDTLRRGMAALRREAEHAVVPRGFAQAARRAAVQRPAAPRFGWPIAAGVALAEGLLAAAVMVVMPDDALRPASLALQGGTAATGATGSGPVPVVYSDGAVDIVGPNPGGHAAEPPRAEPQRVAVLVEWNL